MRISLLIIPFILALITLIYLVFRSLIRVWVDHRVRMTILEKVEHKPELLSAFEDVVSPVENVRLDAEHSAKADPVLTGVSLAVIGVIFVLFNGLLGQSQWAVGAYFGGVACIVLGFILCSVGLLSRFLERGPLRKEPPDPPKGPLGR